MTTIALEKRLKVMFLKVVGQDHNALREGMRQTPWTMYLGLQMHPKTHHISVWSFFTLNPFRSYAFHQFQPPKHPQIPFSAVATVSNFATTPLPSNPQPKGDPEGIDHKFNS